MRTTCEQYAKTVRLALLGLEVQTEAEKAAEALQKLCQFTDAIEASYDRALERLVMARRYMSAEVLDNFDAEWDAFKAAQKTTNAQ